MPEIISADPSSDPRQLKFKFPNPDVNSVRNTTNNDEYVNLITMDNVELQWSTKPKPILSNITCQITLNSRIAIVGPNGKGKSTLLCALTGMNGNAEQLSDADSRLIVRTSPVALEAPPPNNWRLSHRSGSQKPKPAIATQSSSLLWRHHNLRVGVIAQHQIDILSNYLTETPVTYIQLLLKTGSADGSSAYGSDILNWSELDIRSHLGHFGLSSSTAYAQAIGSLSGGQKARLSFAIACLNRPHILFLDEPTNHLALDAIESLINACKEFKGSLVVISHNLYFLNAINCNELYIVNNNKLHIQKPTNGSNQSNDAIQDFSAVDMQELLANYINSHVVEA